PAMPLVGMDVLVKVAVGRRSDPLVPMEACGNGELRRARAFASVGAIGPAMGLTDGADNTRPDVFAELAVTILAMSLVAHLRRGLGLRSQGAHGAGFGNVVADRLFAIDALSELHRDHGRQGVLMVGRGDEN